MSDNSTHSYHLSRHQQCIAMANAASEPGVRRLHLELAQLHIHRAQRVLASSKDARSR